MFTLSSELPFFTDLVLRFCYNINVLQAAMLFHYFYPDSHTYVTQSRPLLKQNTI